MSVADTKVTDDLSVEVASEEAKMEPINVEKQRRKRPRPRRKRKLGKAPYMGPRKMTASVRAQQVRSEMFAHGQPVAPYNTTQFLIEDHGDLQNIDAQLRNAPGSQRPSRTRDSSFSIDSDDDYFYSSPEDEEEFLTKEFSLEYQDLHVERLNALPKLEIIRDYLLLEGKYEKAMTELRKIKGEEQGKVTDSGRDTDASSRSDADIHEQLRLAHVENRRLKADLEKLKCENTHLHSVARHDSGSSVDSESDSSSSTSSSSSSSSSTSPSNTPKSPRTHHDMTSQSKSSDSQQESMEAECEVVQQDSSSSAQSSSAVSAEEGTIEGTSQQSESTTDVVTAVPESHI